MSKITFAGSNLFENDNIVFETPIKRHTMDVIRTAGVLQRPGCFTTMYAGTGTCCHGFLYVIMRGHPKGDLLDHAVSVPTNVMDVLPVEVDYKRAGTLNDHSVALITGYGCAGAGVWLVDYYSIRFIELVGHDELWNLLGPSRVGMPHPQFRVEGQRIFLDASCYAYIENTIDLTLRFETKGVKLAETLELLKHFEKAGERAGEP